MKVKFISSFLVIGLAASSLNNQANASVMTIDFDSGNLNNWIVDREAPADFSIINNELVMTVEGTGSLTGFGATKGMKLDIGKSTYLSIDMFIDSAWTGDERYGGLWANLFGSSDTNTGWPIIEFKGQEGVKAWDNTGWQASNTNYNIGEFNNFKIEITNIGVEYSLNDNLIYTDSVVDASYFTHVLLNAKYEGNDFVVKYDNLVFETIDVPEPSTLAIFALSIMGLASRKLKK